MYLFTALLAAVVSVAILLLFIRLLARIKNKGWNRWILRGMLVLSAWVHFAHYGWRDTVWYIGTIALGLTIIMLGMDFFVKRTIRTAARLRVRENVAAFERANALVERAFRNGHLASGTIKVEPKEPTS